MAEIAGDFRLAVCDLGSNSFRLVVFEAHGERPGTLGGWWRRTDELYEPVRIGAGMDASGALGEAGMARAIAALELFAHFAAAVGLRRDDVDAVGTSAIREATNSELFLRRARAASGLEIRVLSREQEARYGYLAAVSSTDLADGAVLDLGGGSMQLVDVRRRSAGELCSWRLGAVRMTERFLPDGEPPGRKAIARLREHVASRLARAPWLARAERLVGIGGTVRNLAAATQRALGLPSFGAQGCLIERAALDELVERLASIPAAERGALPGIKPARGDIILAGAIVVQAVLEHSAAAGIEATEAGLREGVFFERLLADRPEPLLDDVRRANVMNLAARYDGQPAHTRHVAALALGLFDELAGAGLHGGDPAERELLWASAMLHDIGVAIDYDDHHKHSRYLVLSSGLPGWSPREAALIGQVVRYHRSRKGMPEPGPFGALLDAGDRPVLDRCAVLLRLAEDLERSRDQLVSGAHARVDGRGGPVRLELVTSGDAPVARWAAAREAELFARAFHRALVVV